MHGAVEIRVPIGKGLSGTVAADGNIINIAEAYHDDRFNQAYDKKSGYRTKTILCHPIRADTGAVIGVVQLINKAQVKVYIIFSVPVAKSVHWEMNIFTL